MDLSFLAQVASGIATAATIPAVLASALSVFRKIRAEDRLVKEFSRLKRLEEAQIRRMRMELLKDPPDVEALVECRALIEDTLRRLEKPYREEVLEALTQPTQRGQADYIEKVLADVAKRRATAGASA